MLCKNQDKAKNNQEPANMKKDEKKQISNTTPSLGKGGVSAVLDFQPSSQGPRQTARSVNCNLG